MMNNEFVSQQDANQYLDYNSELYPPLPNYQHQSTIYSSNKVNRMHAKEKYEEKCERSIFQVNSKARWCPHLEELVLKL